MYIKINILIKNINNVIKNVKYELIELVILPEWTSSISSKIRLSSEG